jgi:hypothetical protein
LRGAGRGHGTDEYMGEGAYIVRAFLAPVSCEVCYFDFFLLLGCREARYAGCPFILIGRRGEELVRGRMRLDSSDLKMPGFV